MYPTVDTEAVAAALAQHLPEPRPRVLIAIGSGLEPLADLLWRGVAAPPAVVEGIDVGLPGAGATPPSRIEAGTLGGVAVLVHRGGVRLSDGIDIGAVTAAVDVAAELGATVLVTLSEITALDCRLHPGDLAVVTDHLNLTGHSPLVGGAAHRRATGPVYDRMLTDHAHAAARRAGAALVGIVLAGVIGPEMPTPAERRMLALLGADAVGTGVVMEGLAARARGLRTVALSVVTPGAQTVEEAEAGSRRGWWRDGQLTDAASGERLAAIVGDMLQTLQ